ncbi:membrane protein [Rhizoctonia solani 123E]|uniref:Membrane protein n=1 Tax=Rhizoctonia solani 123E TaxID=1423351 RepID=A0A074SH73_9AGAM|nr:membrane protein [Rhizoctonia solani 123E]
MTHSSSNSSGRATPQTNLCNSFDPVLLKGALALALQEPAPIFFNPHSMRKNNHPYLTSSGHLSNASIASTATICSTTPIRSQEESWRSDDLEKRSDANDNDLSQALADDIAALEPIDNDYHRQRPFWIVSMIWAHQIWWIIAGVINIPFLLYVSKLSTSTARTNYIAQASLINLTITVLVRNELLLAGLYWAFSKIPFRRFYAHRMLHSIGGLHVGCAFGTFIWIMFYTVEVWRSASFDSPLAIGLLVTATILPLGIIIIIIFALRPLRERFHNIWEYTHRYVGWTVVADLVVHLGLKAATLDTPKQLFYTSLPYLTLACLLSIFYIWFTVRHAKISIQANRNVAVVTFPGAPTMRSGTFARISRDGSQWHAFSVAMTNFEQREFSLIIGRAGDWTTGLINDALGSQGPERIYIRGVCPPGFMYMHHAYKKVVTVCTGAGIAPALPHIEQHTSDIMLIWIAKNHRKTYGETVWNAVTSNLPANQVILHDTGLSGRPDIGSLIERAAKAHGAEAVFVVSNDAYTNLCANICWRKGLRCYGATRDS